jgi:hypothetical protein
VGASGARGRAVLRATVLRDAVVFFAVEVAVREDEDLAAPDLADDADFFGEEVDEEVAVALAEDAEEEDESEPALSFRVDVFVL